MHIEFTRGIFIDGEPIKTGTKREVPEHVGRYYIGVGSAKQIDPPKRRRPKKTRETAAAGKRETAAGNESQRRHK